jgi:cytochrome subunit of sulfide dehydrogenase
MSGPILSNLSAAIFCIAAMAPAHAQDGSRPGAQASALHAAGLSATCANCHGTGGKAVEGSPVGSLAGLDRSYFIERMNAFKSGAQPATVMHQISRGFSDAQIESMASYFAAQQK